MFFIRFLFLCALGLMLGACASDQWRIAEGATWGTTYHITYKADRNLNDSILKVMSDVESSLSMFSPTSTVSRLNAGQTDSIDPFFEAVFYLARKVSDASGGKFDPTVAPLVDLWGFGRKGRETTVPDSATVAFALERVGINRCEVIDGRIVKGHPLTEFDFSAIAKGYGVECIADMLLRNGCKDFMVEIGGEIQLAGHNPKGQLWRIQIDAPSADSVPGDSAVTVLKLTDCGIATSGNYRNYRSVGTDSIMGHTIDPTTGYPAPTRIASATVIANSCALADALATALMASSPDSAALIVRRFSATRAILVMADGSCATIE